MPVPSLYYLVEGYRHQPGSRLLMEAPTHSQAVTIQQLTGAISRVTDSGCTAVVTAISEDTFRQFYIERSKERRTKSAQT